MKSTIRSILACLAICCLAILPPMQASAADVIPATTGQMGTAFYQVVDSGAYTNSTTTASDVTGLTVTIPATRVPIARQFIRACVFADVTKATATTGTLTVNIAGSDVAASARQIASAAGRGTISTCWTQARAAATATIVKVRGVSGDTNTFTVHNAHLSVELLTRSI